MQRHEELVQQRARGVPRGRRLILSADEVKNVVSDEAMYDECE